MNREAITAALNTRLSAIAGLKTTGRKPKSFDDLSPSQMPALYVAIAHSRNHQERGKRPSVTMAWTVYLYVNDSSPAGPSSSLNNYIGQVEQALQVQPLELGSQATGFQGAAGGPTTLGGLVSHAGVTEIQTDEGSMGDLGVAILTIEAVTLG